MDASHQINQSHMIRNYLWRCV